MDVAVLVEHELTGVTARRMIELYQKKNIPVRYNLVRAVDVSGRPKESREQAELLVQRSVDLLTELGAKAAGAVSAQAPVDALSGMIQATRSTEVVVVTGPHWLARLLHRDLASRARAITNLPVVHLVDR